MMRIFFIAFLLLYVVTAHAQQDNTTIPSALKSVMLYRSGAQLTHTASAVLRRGDNTLIIDNISNSIDVNSIQVKAPATVTVLGVEFSGNYLPAIEKSAREKMLQDSLDHVQQDIDKVLLAIANINDLLGVLKENRNIKGEQTGMSVTELAKLVDYYKAKSLELQTEMQQLNNKKKKLYDIADKVKSQIAEEQKKNVSTAGRLTLRLSAAMDGRADFSILYMAKNAYWTPYYDVRADNINSPLKLSYKAKITQTTGIDWKQVKLSLSTSSPAQYGSAPLLNPWFLAYLNQYADNKHLDEVVVTGYGVNTAKKELSGSIPGVRIRGVNTAIEDSALVVINGVPATGNGLANIDPADIKDITVLKDAAATSIYGTRAANGVILVTLKGGLEDYISVADNALNITFDIDRAYDVPTNGKEQVATLQNIDVDAIYKHMVIPKLDQTTFLLAQIPGWAKLNLLPGDANIILEGTYVGKSFINPSSTNDTLNLTLGRDERVVVKREKITDFSSVKFLGSNKLQKFTYDITVKNNKSETVNMLLKDQYPLTTNKDIEVELLNSTNAEVNTETGTLAWKLALAPGESKKIRFEYSIKYPKDKTLNLN